MTVDSDNNVYADIRRGASNNCGVIENVYFRAFGRYVFGTLRNEGKIII